MSTERRPDWFPALATTLGTNIGAESLALWKSGMWERDRAPLAHALQSLQASGRSDFFPAGVSAKAIGEAGLRYLCFRTHFLRYTSTPAQADRCRFDIHLILAVAAAVSGLRATVSTAELDPRRGRLIDGTNLFFDGRAQVPRLRWTFDGGLGVIEAGDRQVPAAFSEDRVIASAFSEPWLMALPYDGDFVTFFLERETRDETAATRHVALTHPPSCFKQLQRIKSYLRIRHQTVWDFVRHHVLYVNWTFVPDLISSTDISETRGSVLLNGSLPLDSPEELDAWLASGLYHEAKHLQLFDLKQDWSTAHAQGKESCTVHLSPPSPRVPCAWYGSPTPRTLADHLVSLQAFIPGMVLTLTSLLKCAEWSMWSYDSVETVMRGVNGAMGALLLSRDYLTEAGRAVFDVVLRDYEELLTPLSEMAAPDTRV